ncbi:MAG: hypothetical protein R2847_01675 [Bacteroidia bacterium]
MNRYLLSLTSAALLTVGTTSVNAQRFLTEVFPSVNVTTNVVYAQNYEVLTGTPVLKDLKMDIYTGLRNFFGPMTTHSPW